MPVVTVYTKPLCPYCLRALALLEKKGAAIRDISAAFDRVLREEMRARANGRTTYPQIFIGETHVGGCEELMALEREGRLDELLRD